MTASRWVVSNAPIGPITRQYDSSIDVHKWCRRSMEATVASYDTRINSPSYRERANTEGFTRFISRVVLVVMLVVVVVLVGIMEQGR